LKRHRVVLVDDMPEVIEYVGRILREENYEVIASTVNSQVVLEMAAVREADVIVLDISMPGLNGIELAKSLRASGCRAAIVFLSADENLMEDAMKVDGSAFVSKHRLSSDLVVAIRECLAGRVFFSATE